MGGLAHLTESSRTQHFVMDVIVVGEFGDGLVLDDKVSLGRHQIRLVFNLLALPVIDRYESLKTKDMASSCK